ncbi:MULTISPECIES: thioredoxin [unclassified Mesorhizobium]|uniref:thioredoxin n=5 Tax=Mesorhizobium TaxID=68287 RepID=UPI000BAEF0D5|nr:MULTISPECIES: thioredoxin [unclassified Mesorhizobium]PBB31387.1 thioredoxin [Mesorhizobium sp. WSM3882]RUV06034.1 thioredoxin [Mesorhizobium sp. M1A.F.Ca.IN.020.03.2.1]RUV85423.1 thioredoxin [Mesorhizobium sp. M1A.F.Ca.IN.020.32.1.1]RUW08987.1 thioredoxin [Mesorhizobium sp. M1A.F.Ca.IN.022.05.2.1]RWG97002.1 MAG: thioredoxin [Mesorhizobium sp.]
MSDNNPFSGSFGGNAGQYAQSVHYGGADRGKVSLGEAPAAADLVKDTTTATFAADVIQESRRQPVLVDFWAPWCGPCKQLTPQLEKAVKAAGGKVRLVKMNIDDHPSVAGQLGIQSIPAVIAFKDGQPVDGFMGAIPESQITQFIQKVGGKGGGGAPQITEALAAAAEAREAGDTQTAADIYDAILEQSPETIEAIAGLGEILFEAGDSQGAEAMLAKAPEDKKDAPALAALRAKMTLAAEAAALGNPAEFERRLAANPNDHQARFDLAMVQNARGERMQAADNLLAIVRADRTWNDDGARAQLLKFFEAWGMTDEATLSARRKLSSLLFS